MSVISTPRVDKRVIDEASDDDLDYEPIRKRQRPSKCSEINSVDPAHAPISADRIVFNELNGEIERGLSTNIGRSRSSSVNSIPDVRSLNAGPYQPSPTQLQPKDPLQSSPRPSPAVADNITAPFQESNRNSNLGQRIVLAPRSLIEQIDATSTRVITGSQIKESNVLDFFRLYSQTFNVALDSLTLLEFNVFFAHKINTIIRQGDEEAWRAFQHKLKFSFCDARYLNPGEEQFHIAVYDGTAENGRAAWHGGAWGQ